MGLTWVGALLVSFGFRFWGLQHPEPFEIRPFIVLALLLGPTVGLAIWLFLDLFFKFNVLGPTNEKISDE